MPTDDTRHAKITETFVKEVAYPADVTGNKKVIWWDTEISRFGLRLYPSGKKAFVIIYPWNGREKLKTIGLSGKITVHAARDRAKRDFALLLDNIDPRAAKDADQQAVLFRDFAEIYIEREVIPHHKGAKYELGRIRGHLVKKFGGYKLPHITHEQVAEFHFDLGERQGKKPTATRVTKMLSAMFNKAVDWHYLPTGHTNPADGITHYNDRQRNRYVKPDELPRLIAALEQEDIYARSAIWLYLLTGFRKSELLHATWEQIDLGNRLFNLPDTKNGEPLWQPLTQEAITVLEGIPRLQGNPYIFPSPKVPGQPLGDFKGPWKRIRQNAGLEDVHLHDLRHTVGSWLIQGGNSLYLVQKILNHKDSRTTERYAHFAQDNLRNALEGNNQRLLDTLKKAD